MIFNRVLFKIFPILILAFIASCGEDRIFVPDHILTKEKMVELMTDVHIAEAILIQATSIDSSRSSESYYAGIYEKHEITAKQFDESYLFYIEHPDLFKAVYDEVLIELSEKQAKAAN